MYTSDRAPFWIFQTLTSKSQRPSLSSKTNAKLGPEQRQNRFDYPTIGAVFSREKYSREDDRLNEDKQHIGRPEIIMAHFPTKTLSLPTGFRILKAKEAGCSQFPIWMYGGGGKVEPT